MSSLRPRVSGEVANVQGRDKERTEKDGLGLLKVRGLGKDADGLRMAFEVLPAMNVSIQPATSPVSQTSPTSQDSPTSPAGIDQLVSLGRSQKPPGSNATIGFWSMRPTDSPDNTPSLSNARPINSTLAWYHSLANKTIKNLQLHKFGSDPFFNVFITGDGSQFRLDFSPQNGIDQRQLLAFGVVTPIPDTMELDPTLWIDIQVHQGSKETEIDVRFLISICYAAFITLVELTPEHQSICALSLAASIARRSLPVHDHLVGSTGTILDDFWQSLLSLDRVVGQSLWEESISEQMRFEVSKWIYRTSRDHVAMILTDRTPAPNQPTPGPSACPGRAEAEQAVIPSPQQRAAASVVAWLEFLAGKYEAASVAVWDAEWDKTWREKWDEHWEASWGGMSAAQTFTAQVEFLSNINELIPRLLATSANGRPSGRAAGRAAIDIATVAEAVEMPEESLLNLKTEYLTLRGGIENRGTVASRDIPPNLTGSFEDGFSNWLEAWRLMRHPHSSQKWLPAWEAASDMAWALAWGKAVDRGQQMNLEAPQRSTSDNPTSAPDLPSQGGTNVLAGSHTQGPGCAVMRGPVSGHSIPMRSLPAQPKETAESATSLNIRNLAKGAWVGFEKVLAVAGLSTSEAIINSTATNTQRRIVEPDLSMLSDFAWKEVQNNPSSPEANLRIQAQIALDLVKKQVNLSSHVINPFASQPQDRSSIWEGNFIKTWEETWKECWKAAWLKVMDYNIDHFWERGVAEGKFISKTTGPSRAVDPMVNLHEGAQASYKKIKDYISSGSSLEDCYWRIHSMFKALGLLHNALAHSIPSSHHGAMEIWRSSERALLVSAPGRKLKGGRDAEARFSRKQLTHGELQKEIKELVKKHYCRKQPEVGIGLMEQIWRLAIETNNNPSLMDDKEPEPHELAPQRRQTQLSVGAKTPAIKIFRGAVKKLINVKRIGPKRRQSSRGDSITGVIPPVALSITPGPAHAVAAGSMSTRADGNVTNNQARTEAT